LFYLNETSLTPNQRVIPYTLQSTLFSDYSHKFRTITVPKNQNAILLEDGTVDFPIGSVISKTFYYPKDSNNKVKLIEQGALEDNINLSSHQLIETRLLVKRPEGWVALPYIWNEDQSEATLCGLSSMGYG